MPLTPEQIKAIRGRLGLSQAAFARKLRVTLQTVKSWEAGRRNCTGPAEVLVQLFDLLEPSTDKGTGKLGGGGGSNRADKGAIKAGGGGGSN